MENSRKSCHCEQCEEIHKDDVTLMARWLVDSETGQQVLVDEHSFVIIARKDKDGRIMEDSNETK